MTVALFVHPLSHLSVFLLRFRFDFPLETSAFRCAFPRSCLVPSPWLFHSPSVASFRAIWSSKAFDRVQYYSAAIEISDIFRSTVACQTVPPDGQCKKSSSRVRKRQKTTSRACANCRKFHQFPESRGNCQVAPKCTTFLDHSSA